MYLKMINLLYAFVEFEEINVSNSGDTDNAGLSFVF